jgi:hypothetical protein
VLRHAGSRFEPSGGGDGGGRVRIFEQTQVIPTSTHPPSRTQAGAPAAGAPAQRSRSPERVGLWRQTTRTATFAARLGGCAALLALLRTPRLAPLFPYLSRAKSVKSLGAVTLATTSLSSLSTLDSDEGGGAGGAGFGARRGRRGSKRMINLSHAALHKMQQRNTITEKAGGSRSNPPHSPPRRSC